MQVNCFFSVNPIVVEHSIRDTQVGIRYIYIYVHYLLLLSLLFGFGPTPGEKLPRVSHTCQLLAATRGPGGMQTPLVG